MLAKSQYEIVMSSALVDTSVWRLAEFARPVRIREQVSIFGREQTIEILNMRRIGPYESWKELQIEALPTIARLTREGILNLFDYNEIELETMKGTILGGAVVYLLENVPIFYAKSPVERSRFQQTDMDAFANKETFIRFCKVLLSVNLSQRENKSDVRKLIPNLESIERFKEICRDLSETHYPDAYHLWAAETNKMEYFLTTDKKFIQAMTRTKRTRLNSQPIAPRDLLNQLGIAELDPLPIADWAVRPL